MVDINCTSVHLATLYENWHFVRYGATTVSECSCRKYKSQVCVTILSDVNVRAYVTKCLEVNMHALIFFAMPQYKFAQMLHPEQ